MQTPRTACRMRQTCSGGTSRRRHSASRCLARRCTPAWRTCGLQLPLHGARSHSWHLVPRAACQGCNVPCSSRVPAYACLKPSPNLLVPQFLDDSFEGPGGEAVRRGEPQRDARRRMGTLVWRGFHHFHFLLTTGPIAATPNAAESAASFSCIIVPCLWCAFP